MPRALRPLPALALALLALVAPAGASVPRDWAGVMVDYPQLVDSPKLLTSELGVMRANRVGSIRIALYWSRTQPYATMADVPESERDRFVNVDGIPTDLSAFDAVFAAAARQRIAVLPVVLDAPPWAAGRTPDGLVTQPRRPRDYARYLTTLVRRYGPDGTFWIDHPRVPRRPIRRWQIWNEPNLPSFWSRPWVPGYAALLSAAYRAVKSADPGAQVYTAGMTGVSWDAVKRLYRAGIRRHYDVLALNTFTAQPQNLLRAIRLNREVQQRFHDVRPIALTEITWDASKGRIKFSYGWSTTPRDQAAKLTQALQVLASARRRYSIAGVFWYAWLTGYAGRDPFDYSGLRVWRPDGSPASTPALSAFRRVLGKL